MRPRKARIRREPIDLEQLAADFAELPRRDEQEILVALQAEVQRAHATRQPLPEPELEVAAPEPEVPAVDPFGIAGDVVAPARAPSSRVGLPLEQVRAWLERVQEDLRRIEARVQFLEAEQTRLQEQHHIVAELITSSTPV